jgi:hypothetical protein
VLAERLTAQLLAGSPAVGPEAVAERLLAVQAQELRGARLAVRARTRGLSAADVDRALGERTLVVTWLNRGTLHLVRSEDLAWLHAVTTPPLLTATWRRLGQEGVSRDAAERGVRTVERALTGRGPLTRGDLRSELDAAGVPTAGQALVHVLALASLRGLVVRGPVVGAEQAFVLARDWLGEPPAVDRDAALAELARRYLAGHGPANDRDLARWAGVTLRDARAGLGAIAGTLVERPDGLLDLRDRPAAAPPPPPRLLGPFEPLLLGWRSREPVVGPREAALVTTNGIFRPFLLVEGRAAGTWTMRHGEVALAPFTPLGPATATALDADAADLRRFLAAEG